VVNVRDVMFFGGRLTIEIVNVEFDVEYVSMYGDAVG